MIGEMSAKMLMVVDRIWKKEKLRQLFTAGKHIGCQKHLMLFWLWGKANHCDCMWGRRTLTPPSLASSEQVPTPEFLESHKISKEKLMRQKDKKEAHLTWVGINSAVHIHSIEKEADTQKLGWGKGEKSREAINLTARSPAYHGDHHHWHLVNVFPPREESMKKLLKVIKSPGKEAIDEEEESGKAVEANIREAPTHPGLWNKKITIFLLQGQTYTSNQSQELARDIKDCGNKEADEKSSCGKQNQYTCNISDLCTSEALPVQCDAVEHEGGGEPVEEHDQGLDPQPEIFKGDFAYKGDLTWGNAWCPSGRPSSQRRQLVVSKIFPPHSPEKTFNLSHLINFEKDLATVPSGSSKKDSSANKIYDLILKWSISPCLTDSSLCQKPSMESVRIRVIKKFGRLKQENLGDSGRKKRRKGRTTAGADTTWVS